MTRRLPWVIALLVVGGSASVSAQGADALPPPSTPQSEPQVVYVPVPPEQTYYTPNQMPPARQRRYREPYVEGMPIPPGGEIIERRKLGLMIPGVIMFGMSYICTLSYWGISSDIGNDPPGTLLVPVLGPFIAMGHYESSTGRVALGWAGAMQVAGVAMFALGAIPRRYVQYYAGTGEGTSFALMPRTGPGEIGLDFGLRF